MNYRRLSWQSDDGELRVTFDRGLGVVSRRPRICGRAGTRWCAARWASPAAQEASGVLEVKRRGAMPAWLVDCLVAIGVRPVPFSKFVTAARAVEAHA